LADPRDSQGGAACPAHPEEELGRARGASHEGVYCAQLRAAERGSAQHAARRNAVDCESPGRRAESGGLRGAGRGPNDRRRTIVDISPEYSQEVSDFVAGRARLLRTALEQLEPRERAALVKGLRAVVAAFESGATATSG
ncbi:MAG TPA: hypothetical protein VKK19_00210, partial [Candidatus Dormibacteraeota bacterium]|nr:hypothetical protein [Candidatus Dormibacteraeota bacterium]